MLFVLSIVDTKTKEENVARSGDQTSNDRPGLGRTETKYHIDCGKDTQASSNITKREKNLAASRPPIDTNILSGQFRGFCEPIHRAVSYPTGMSRPPRISGFVHPGRKVKLKDVEPSTS